MNNAGRSQTTQPVRLPQIQLPDPERNSNRFSRQPISTCPSLHQHQSRDSGGHSTRKLLREFFARPDDSTAYPAVSSSSTNDLPPRSQSRSNLYGEPSTPVSGLPQNVCNPLDNRHALTPPRYESIERASTSHQVSSRSSTSTFNRSNETRAGNFSSGGQPQAGSSNSRRLSVTESSAMSGAEESDSGKDSFRCTDCNRKCKSMASYMKHKSLMCTHRMGPLTLECRYCKRPYTYAGYLQKHEMECARSRDSAGHRG